MKPNFSLHFIQLFVVLRYESSIYKQPITYVHPFPIYLPSKHVEQAFLSQILQLIEQATH